MADFQYVARDNSGQRVTGTIAAPTRREALAGIAGRALFPVEVTGAGEAATVKLRKHVKPQAVAAMYGQLADLLRAGVPLLRSLDVLRRQSRNAGTTALLEEIHHRVEEGASLAEAMLHFPNVFGEVAISMVRAGGEGGFLEEALTRVAEFTEAQDDLKKRVTGAMAYPAFLAAAGAVIVTILLVFFVPKFETLFGKLRERGELPAITDVVLGLSRFLQERWYVIVAVVVIIVLAMRRWLKTEAGRVWKDRMKIGLPVAGSIFLSLAIARFCRVLGTLLRNGVPILRSLEISSDAAANRLLSKAIEEASQDVSAGQRLAGRLAASGRFPPSIVEMIAVAEESNTLETVLLTTADSLEKNTWRRLDLAVRLLEPMLLMIMAGIVLILVLALLLPIIKMGTTIQ